MAEPVDEKVDEKPVYDRTGRSIHEDLDYLFKEVTGRRNPAVPDEGEEEDSVSSAGETSSAPTVQ